MGQLWSFEFQKIVGRKLIRVGLLAYGVLILIILSNSRVDFLDIFDQNGRHLHGKEALEYELKMAEQNRGPVTEEKGKCEEKHNETTGTTHAVIERGQVGC